MTEPTQTTGPVPGWYADIDDPELLRYWDGYEWTDQTQPAPVNLLTRGQALIQQGRDARAARRDAVAADLEARGILCAFEARVDGRRTHVAIHADIVEWSQPRGLFGKLDEETLPVIQIVSVAARADGFLHAVLSLRTAGEAREFRAAKRDVEAARGVLAELIVKAGIARTPNVTVQVAGDTASVPTVEQLATLAALHAQGALSDDEFAAAKAKLLGL
jgi:hypothetical protein